MKGDIMRKRSGLSLGAALIFCLTACPATNSGADPLLVHNRLPWSRPVQALNTSGQYTGMLGGEILLGGNSYQLAPDAIIYEIGNGFLPAGTVVANRYVFLSGTKSGDTNLVDLVIVRPASDSWPDRSDPATHIHLLDTAAMQ